ncbi:MAG TPA: hypothetical protein VFR27_14990 [Mycobacterium sp.]|nr:hypothetical protein [Mycobacterium sp.]
MTNDTQSTADLIERTLESLRTASADVEELIEHGGGIAALVQTAKGTALIHNLRLELNQLNKLLPFKS